MDPYKKKTIAYYDHDAKVLSEKFKALLDLKRRYEFQRFIELLAGDKILDVGSGSGDHALYFKQQGLEVICVDLSNKMVELCKRKGLKTFLMDMEDLQFADASFDGIWAVTSLVHIPKAKLPAVRDKLHALLRKKGILYVCVKEGEGEGFVGENHSRRFFAFWKKDELVNFFAKKFNLIEFKRVTLGKRVFLECFFQKR